MRVPTLFLLAVENGDAAGAAARRIRLMNGLFGLDDSAWSLVGQVGSLILAFLIARFVMTSRAGILLACMIGGFGAMLSHVVVDGQGAGFLLVVVPILYAIVIRLHPEHNAPRDPTLLQP